MSLDLSAAMRAAIIGESAITTALAAYKGSYPVFTRVPVPDDAPLPMVVVHAQFPGAQEDGIADSRPTIIRDVTVYGVNDPNDPSKYTQVETIADAVWDVFHRQRDAISVSGWSVVDITARPPQPAPVDDEQQTVGRRVEVSVHLAKQT